MLEKQEQVLSFLNISKLEVAMYFIEKFYDSFTIVCAFLFFMGCLFGSMAYLSFMEKNEQKQCSVLNVLYGNISAFSIISSLVEFIGVFGQKTNLDDENLMICFAFNVRNMLRFIYIIMFIPLTIGVLLFHLRPGLYLKLSLIWKNKVFIFLVLAVGIGHRVGTMKDNQFENICSECIISECDITIWRKMNRGFVFISMLVCLLIQLGVFIDVKFGIQNIMKKIQNPDTASLSSDLNQTISNMVSENI